MVCEKMSIKGLAFAGGILWGGCVLFVGILNLKFAGYGQAFLDIVGSVYPGYDSSLSTFKSVFIVTGYALVDGAIGGALLAWLYNIFAGSKK